MDIAAVCCHFNPFHSRRRLRNYHCFRRLLRDTPIRLLTVELAFAADRFELPPSPDVLQLRGGDIMWQKERLHQIGAERLIEGGCTKLVFLDADIIFPRADWPAQVSRALDDAPVVQCFSRAIRKFSDTVSSEDAAVKIFRESGEIDRGAPGIAWAMRAELFEKAGLYQHCVVGGGDRALCLAALRGGRGEPGWGEALQHQPFLRHAGSLMQEHFLRWADRFHGASGGGCAYVEQTVLTMACGSHRARDYFQRHRILEQFDPGAEISPDRSGAFAWTATGGKRAQPTEHYFRSRDDVAP